MFLDNIFSKVNIFHLFETRETKTEKKTFAEECSIIYLVKEF